MKHADGERYLFSSRDLRALFVDMSETGFRSLLSRSLKIGLLKRVCRGIYFYDKAYSSDGLFLFHVAALLRANKFNYISLETALSDAGVISQIPINTVTIMSSGRSSVITLETPGKIEFVHTNQKPENLTKQLIYDEKCKMWRAKVPLAIRDMKATHRNCDLIDWDLANELI